jgi:acyl dehydratase
MSKRYWQDLTPGQVLWSEPVTIEREELLAYAHQFDPQPMHTDPEAARALGFDDIICPGTYTLALATRALVTIDLALMPSGLGLQLDYQRPVCIGDTLRLRFEIADMRSSRKPGRGQLSARQAFVNQRQETALAITGEYFIALRDKAETGIT